MRTEHYRKSPDRQTAVIIQQERRIGGGIYGDIFDATATVHGREKRFVIKRFKDTNTARSGRRTAEQNAAQAFQNYDTLKNLGGKVFPTYRLSEDGKSVLMTMGHSEQSTCLGSNAGSSELTDFGQSKIEAIADFNKFVENYLARAEQLGQTRSLVDADAYFFLVDSAEPTAKLDFVIGDIDNITFNVSPDLVSTNIAKAWSALASFMRKNLTDPDKSLWQQAEAIYRSFMDKYKKTKPAEGQIA